MRPVVSDTQLELCSHSKDRSGRVNSSTYPVLLEDAFAASAVRATAALTPCVAIASHFSHVVPRWPACAGKLGFTRARRAESCCARVGRSPSVMCAATTVHRVLEDEDLRNSYMIVVRSPHAHAAHAPPSARFATLLTVCSLALCADSVRSRRCSISSAHVPEHSELVYYHHRVRPEASAPSSRRWSRCVDIALHTVGGCCCSGVVGPQEGRCGASGGSPEPASRWMLARLGGLGPYVSGRGAQRPP